MPRRVSIPFFALVALLLGTRTAGRHVVRWDGRDRAGRPLPAGVYFCVLDGAERRVARFVLVR